MATVGRKRKDGNPLGLERRVYWHHGQWRYRHATGAWQDLGTDVEKANEKARALNNPRTYGTLGYWIRAYIAAAKAGDLPAGKRLSERSIEDYEEQAEYIEASPLWTIYAQDIVRDHTVLGEYRDRRVGPDGRGKTRANRELSLVSSTFEWLIELRHVPGLVDNPVKLITRFKENPKERYVEDYEYRPVYGVALRSVCMALELTYRTLQRPADILGLPPAAVRTKSVAGVNTRILSVRQGKTGRVVDIEATPELEQALYMLTPDGALGSVRLAPTVSRMVQTLVHTAAGKQYTEDGFGSMLRRYCVKAGVKTFGLMDVRAKGATDMYLRDVPLEHIQMLMGHASVTTTEIYIKRLLATVRIAKPNAIAIAS